MKAIIIDDEVPSLILFKLIIAKYEYIEIIKEYTNPSDALVQIPSLSPDVIFIDIEMPNLNGIELAKKIKEHDENIQVVFVTAYEKYALNAFEVSAVNYILKPITEEDLSITINRLMKNYNNQRHLLKTGSEALKIVAFGGFQVYGMNEHTMISFPTKKVQELFAYFVYHRDKQLDKWQLCEILWPDSSPKNAEHSLHSSISRMRHCLKEAGVMDVLSRNKSHYRSEFVEFKCDLWEFEVFVARNPIVINENIVQFERMIELYQGNLFGTEDYIWALDLRENLHEEYLNILKKVINYYINLKNHHQSEQYLRKFIELSPYDEEIMVMLMNVYADAGNKLELIHAYNRFESVLKYELNVTPTATLLSHYNYLLTNL